MGGFSMTQKEGKVKSNTTLTLASRHLLGVVVKLTDDINEHTLLAPPVLDEVSQDATILLERRDVAAHIRGIAGKQRRCCCRGLVVPCLGLGLGLLLLLRLLLLNLRGGLRGHVWGLLERCVAP